MELIDGYNKDNEPTGYIVERFEAFDKGLWKRTVSCWVLNDEGKVILLKDLRPLIKDCGKGQFHVGF